MGNQSSCKCIKPSRNSQLYQSTVIEVYNNTFFIKGKLNFQKQSTFKKLQIAASQYCVSSGIGIQYIPLIMRLLAFNHDNIFQALSSLPKQRRIQFIDEIGTTSVDLMDSLYQYLILNQDRKRILNSLKKQNLIQTKGLNSIDIKIQDKFDLVNKGITLLRNSKVAIVFMCGGSSSRFYFQDKFLHPLNIFTKQTTILKLLMEKLRYNYRPLRKQDKIDIPIIIVGNQTNTNQIEDYMKENKFFQFNKANIYFSDIPSLPILDQYGKICLNFQFNYLRRPKGSATYLEELLHPKAQQLFQQKSIQYIHFVGSQNLAESPGDPLFLGLTHMLKRKVAMKCTSAQQPFENFDRLLTSKDSIRVLDRSSLEYINNKILFQSNIAMNSMIISVSQLGQLVQKFNKDLHPSGLYRQIQIRQNIYDFALRKPLINQKCWSFEKDIKDIVSVCKKPLIFNVQRKQFIPLITAKNEYSVEQVSHLYEKFYPQKNQKQGVSIKLQHSIRSSTVYESRKSNYAKQ